MRIYFFYKIAQIVIFQISKLEFLRDFLSETLVDKYSYIIDAAKD